MVLSAKSLFWRGALLAFTLAFWVGVIVAQGDTEAVVEESTNFGPIWAIIIFGLGAVATLGFVMNSRNDAENE